MYKGGLFAGYAERANDSSKTGRSLLKFDNKRYLLTDFVVMPNKVFILKGHLSRRLSATG